MMDQFNFNTCATGIHESSGGSGGHSDRFALEVATLEDDFLCGPVLDLEDIIEDKEKEDSNRREISRSCGGSNKKPKSFLSTSNRSIDSLNPIDYLNNLVVAYQESLLRKPNAHTNQKDVDDDDDADDDEEEGLSDLTRKLNQLSMLEREKATYDLHGVAPPLTQEHDSPEMIEQALKELDRLILQQAEQHPGLAKALQVNPDYIRSERMKFLRSDEYDPVKSSERMGGYFDMRLEFFCGASAKHSDSCACIARDLTILDLTEEDVEYWKTGFYQVCREKDRSGRIVCIIFLPLCYKFKIPAANMVRINFVVNAILTQNIDVQKSGNVHIAWAVGMDAKSIEYMGSGSKSIVEAGKYAPLRGVAKHYCYNHESLHPMFQRYARPMATFNAVRFRSHFGKQSEVTFNLSTFGISADSLPISPDGLVKTDFHHGFIQSLLQQQRNRDDHRREMEERHFLQRSQLHLQEQQQEPRNLELREVASGGLRSAATDVLQAKLDQPLPFMNNREAANVDLTTALMMMPVESLESDELPNLDPIQIPGIAISCGSLEGAEYSGLGPRPLPEELLSLGDLGNLESTPILDAPLYPTNETVVPSVLLNARASAMGASTVVTMGSLQPPPPTAEMEDGLLLALSPMDVIFGRGSHNKNNPGNVWLKLLLEEYKDEYDSPSTGRTRKTEIVSNIVEHMHAAGSRFVYEVFDDDDSGMLDNNSSSNSCYCPKWTIAPIDKVKNKITHDFRNLRRSKTSKKWNNQDEGASSNTSELMHQMKSIRGNASGRDSGRR